MGGRNAELDGLQVGAQRSGFPRATRGTYGVPELLCTLHMRTAGERPLLVVSSSILTRGLRFAFSTISKGRDSVKEGPTFKW